jgi:hypothetical protein
MQIFICRNEAVAGAANHRGVPDADADMGVAHKTEQAHKGGAELGLDAGGAGDAHQQHRRRHPRHDGGPVQGHRRLPARHQRRRRQFGGRAGLEDIHLIAPRCQAGCVARVRLQNLHQPHQCFLCQR